MYRVYDTEEQRWITNNIYLSPDPNSKLYALKKNIFGKMKMVPVSDERYVIHKSIDLYDRNKELIYQGDYIKASVADDRIVIGMVAYAYEISAYVILCFNNSEYFSLGSNVSEHIEVIGNVFDGHKEDNKNDGDKQAL